MYGLLFFKVNDAQKAATMTAGQQPQSAQKEQHGGNTLFIRRGWLTSWAEGVVGNYAVHSDLPIADRVRRLMKGEATEWKPACGGGELCSGELYLLDLLTYDSFGWSLARSDLPELPPSVPRLLEKRFEHHIPFSAGIMATPEGLSLQCSLPGKRLIRAAAATAIIVLAYELDGDHLREVRRRLNNEPGTKQNRHSRHSSQSG
jgi:hypothetical protein